MKPPTEHRLQGGVIGVALGVLVMFFLCVLIPGRDTDEAEPTTDDPLVEALQDLAGAIRDSATTTTTSSPPVTTAPSTTATTRPSVPVTAGVTSTEPPHRTSVPTTAAPASAAGQSGIRLVSTAYCLRGTMANGEQVHAGAAASNHFPLGTRVTVLDTGASYIIKDRSAPGATGLDIWMSSCEAARNYGRRSVTVAVS